MTMKITDSIKYIGADDTTLDLFESQYKLSNGVSYNSYLIIDEKTVIMDTVDARASEQWLENLTRELNGKKPDYLVISHLEPDHSANIKKIAELYPEMQLIGNAKTFSMLPQFFDLELSNRTITVTEGMEINIGEHTLQFFMAPMVHWPEVMVTYEKKDKILFSADGFGKFGALCCDEEWDDEARRYYINIVGKYGIQVQALLKKAAALDIQMICPLHGPVLKENLPHYIELYDIWSSFRYEESGILLAYASIHGNTAKAVEQMVQILKDNGETNLCVMDLSRCDQAEAVANAFRYDRMLLACSTYDGGLFPPMEEFLSHLKAKSFQKRTIGLIENGSWGPLAAKKMREVLDTMKELSICENIVTIKSAVKPETVDKMCALAKELVK